MTQPPYILPLVSFNLVHKPGGTSYIELLSGCPQVCVARSAPFEEATEANLVAAGNSVVPYFEEALAKMPLGIDAVLNRLRDCLSDSVHISEKYESNDDDGQQP